MRRIQWLENFPTPIRSLGIACGLMWLAALGIWLSGHTALDADALVVGDICERWRSGGHLGDWNTCPHPYLFPDAIVYGWIARLTSDWVLRQIVFGLLVGAAIWWMLAKVFRHLWNISGDLSRIYAGIGLMPLLPFLTWSNGLGAVFVPGYHAGSFLCLLGVIAGCLNPNAMRERSPWPWALGMALWFGATWASDALAPVWVLPTLLVFALGGEGERKLRLLGVAIAAYALKLLIRGYWTHLGMRIERFQWPYFFAHISDQFGAFGAVVSKQGSAEGVLYWVAAVAVLLLAFERKRNPGSFRLVLVLMGLVAAGIALAVLTGTAPGRYFTASVWLGAPCFPAAFSRRVHGKWPLAVVAALGLVGFVSLAESGTASDVQKQARWLDARLGPTGLKLGVADYWHARPLRMLNRSGMVLAPVETGAGRFEPFLVSVDRNLFGQVDRVEFVVLNGLEPSVVSAKLGPPSEIIQGEGLTVWIYGRAKGVKTPPGKP
jgi:hypothetical protein